MATDSLKPLQLPLGCSRTWIVGPIYHLGDVCDSTHPETTEACLGLLRDPGVIIIKFELTEKIP